MKRTVCLGLLLLGLAGCGSIHDSPDFYRHSLSQMSEPREGGDYVWFDVKFSPENPNNNENAEAMRLQWLEAWLDVRKICGDGYVILERREFDFLEHNAGRYDMRYKVQCDIKAPT